MRILPRSAVDPSTTVDQNSLGVNLQVLNKRLSGKICEHHWMPRTTRRIIMNYQFEKKRVKTLYSLGPTMRQLIKLKNYRNTKV